LSPKILLNAVHTNYGWGIRWRGNKAEEIAVACMDIVDETLGDFEISINSIDIVNKPFVHALYFGERQGEKAIASLLDFLKCLVMKIGARYGSCSMEIIPSIPLMIKIDFGHEDEPISEGEILITVPTTAIEYEKEKRYIDEVISDEASN